MSLLIDIEQLENLNISSIYTGDGTIPSSTVATLTDTLTFDIIDATAGNTLTSADIYLGAKYWNGASIAVDSARIRHWMRGFISGEWRHYLQLSNNPSITSITIDKDGHTAIGGGQFSESALDIFGITGDTFALRVNSNGGDFDTSIEGLTNPNLFYVNAGTDRIGIGTSVPTSLLDVRGGAVFNINNIDADFQVGSVGSDYTFFVDAFEDNVGINTNSPGSKLHVVGENVADEQALRVDAGTGFGLNALVVKRTSSNLSWVGIGTDTEGAGNPKLDVAGNTRISGSLLLGGVSATSNHVRMPNGWTLRIGAKQITDTDGFLFISDLFKFRATGAGETMLEVNRNSPEARVIGTARDAGSSSTIQRHSLRQISTYWDGVVAQSLITDIRNKPTDTVGNYNLEFIIGGSEKMIIDQDGNVGIGTTSTTSGYTLDVRGGAVFNVDNVNEDFQVGSVSFDDMFFVDASADAIGIGTNGPTAKLDINGSTGYDQLRLRTNYTPTGTADANGNTGDFAWDDNFIYVKTSAGWKRSALSTF